MCAGWWKVGKDEFILIDEIVEILSKFSEGKRSIKLSIFADCPGAAGIFFRLI